MPSDLNVRLDADFIDVRDRAGIGLPFSKGIMATSILATGMETARAHRIAAGVERDLRRRGASRIEADELAEMAAEAIRGDAGEEFHDRYRAWRHAKRSGRPFVVCLGGASGVGKSTLATRLAMRLGVNRVVTTDAIREVLRTVIPPTVLPELHVSTFERIDDATSPTESFLRQARAVSAATAAVVRRFFAEGRSSVVEGVHLLPGSIARELKDTDAGGIVIELLLTLDDEVTHRGHLMRRRHSEPARDGTRHLEKFRAIREMQAQLRGFAGRNGVIEFDIARPGGLTQMIVDRLVERMERDSDGCS